jgi:hypothetical protein
MTTPRLMLSNLPPWFITTAEVEARIGRRERSVRNDCLEKGIALRVTRPCGGPAWAVHEAAYDTGLVDGVRLYVSRLDGLSPGDTGPLLDAHRDWAHLADTD